MLSYELRLFHPADGTARVYPFQSMDDRAALLYLANFGDARYQRVELWRGETMLYAGPRIARPHL